MSSKYTSEFKAKVAAEAIEKQDDIFASLAEKYEVSKSDVEAWSMEFKKEPSGSVLDMDDESDVNIETTDENFVAAVKHGVEEEALPMGTITKWSLLGVGAVLIFIVTLIFVGKDAFTNATANAGNTSTYKKVEDLNREAETILSSYGVVDSEEGIYRIPIDEAINKIAVD